MITLLHKNKGTEHKNHRMILDDAFANIYDEALLIKSQIFVQYVALVTIFI